MWFLFGLATFFAWGIADLFYKRGSDPGDRYSHLKIVTIVGLTMGAHAICYLIWTPGAREAFVPFDLVRYLPVSSMYILSMTIGYIGLRYIELSISSPVQNSSGAITAILLIVFFGAELSGLEYAGIIIICLAVFLLSVVEKREDDRARALAGETVDPKYRCGVAAIAFPILYCIVDGLGTFLDGVYLDELALISEHSALVSYELTFLIVGLCAWFYVRVWKRQPFSLFREPYKWSAALFETAGQFFYVFSMSQRAVITAPLVASYCMLSVLLSRIFLKEALRPIKYMLIAAVFFGILLLGVAEGLAG